MTRGLHGYDGPYIRRPCAVCHRAPVDPIDSSTCRPCGERIREFWDATEPDPGYNDEKWIDEHLTACGYTAPPDTRRKLEIVADALTTCADCGGRHTVSWVKLDGKFWMHPKVLVAGNEAAGIYARCLSYCAATKRGDVVPRDVLEEIGGFFAAEMLIDAELAEEHPDGIHIPDIRRGPVAEAAARALRKRQAAGHASRQQIQARIDFYGGLCWICRAAPARAMDHVKPLACGGSNWPANLRPACTSCNSRKGARWPFVREAMA